MLRTASSLPLTGPLTPGSGPARFRPDRQPATGPPGSYPDRTSTGKRRRAYEHEQTPWHYVTVSPPALLGAQIPGIDLHCRAPACSLLAPGRGGSPVAASVGSKAGFIG